MDPAYADRYLNVGFSGGEKKKAEILQLLMLKPSLALLDETDSGLDVDAVKTVANGIKAYHNDTNALIIITHNAKILEGLQAVSYTHLVQLGDRDVEHVLFVVLDAQIILGDALHGHPLDARIAADAVVLVYHQVAHSDFA